MREAHDDLPGRSRKALLWQDGPGVWTSATRYSVVMVVVVRTLQGKASLDTPWLTRALQWHLLHSVTLSTSRQASSLKESGLTRREPGRRAPCMCPWDFVHEMVREVVQKDPLAWKPPLPLY
jgi:hypothetical protein